MQEHTHDRMQDGINNRDQPRRRGRPPKSGRYEQPQQPGRKPMVESNGPETLRCNHCGRAFAPRIARTEGEYVYIICRKCGVKVRIKRLDFLAMSTGSLLKR